METINNNYRNFFKKVLEDYVDELKRNYNTTIDTKALNYLADKLTTEATKEKNPNFFKITEKNISKIFMNDKIIISSENVDNGLYENCFNLATKEDTESKKQVLLIQTDKYNYILGNNGLFKFGKDNNIYNYYTFKKNGEIETKTKVDHNTGLLISKNEIWRFNTEAEREKIKSSTNINYQGKELIKKLLNPRKISTNLDIKPNYEAVMYTLSDKGRIRRNNEDSVTAISHPKDSSIKMLAVADGMGGYSNGEKASSYTISKLENWFRSLDYTNINNSFNLQVELFHIVSKINHTLKISNIQMGTTLTCAIVTHNKTIVINIGDSRCYIMKDTNIKQVTDDDSDIYERYKKGKLTKDDLRFHPYNHILNKGLGLDDTISPWTARPKVFDNDSYDKLLLFTDGVTDCLSDEKIKLIANTSRKDEIIKNIINEAVNVEQEEPKNITLSKDFRVHPTPGKDNATGAILIKR